MAENITSNAGLVSSSPTTPAPESQVSGEALENEGLEQSGEAQAAAPTKEEVSLKKTLKKLKIKVDGQDFDEELPFEIPDDEASRQYMTKQLQMSKAAQKRMGEYSQLEKEVRDFVEELKKNPRKVLSDPNINIDLKKLATEMIEEEISNSQKSPEQLAKEKLENELKSLKEEREKEKQDAQAKEFERLQEQAYERYDVQMTKALEGSDLPKSPYVVKKMADYMMMAIQNGIDASPEDVLPLVRQEIMDDVKSMFSVMPEDVVEGIVGKETINKIRKKNLAAAKTKPPAPLGSAIKDTGTKSGSEKQEPGQKINYKKFFGV